MSLQSMNSQQQLAVTTIERPCLVLAGAGSGKTRVITQKIVHLIEKHQYPAHTIRAVTFTNKSAREMKQRVQQSLDAKQRRGLKISTFHTLGLNIIQQEYFALAYRKGFSIIDSKDTENCIRELQHKTDPDKDQIKQTQYQISHWKNGFVSPKQALAQADGAIEQHNAQIYTAYQTHIKACNTLDFDDLIMQPVVLFRGNAELLNKWQNRIKYLLVDEYQDTNTSQYELIKLLCGIRQKLTVVGDDDQSIYAWRGAKPENLMRLKDDFQQLQIIKLEQNYRSTHTILNAANAVIKNNPHTLEKKLWSAASEGEKINVLPCNTANDEANKVIIDLISSKFQSAIDYKSFAILYRGNFQSRIYENALRDQNIPYQITGGTAFFERSEIKDIIAYLRLITNPTDDTALLRIINTPRREIGSTTLKTLGEYAASRHSPLSSVLNEVGLKSLLSPRAWIRLEQFTGFIGALQKKYQEQDALSFTRSLLTQLAYKDWLKNSSSSEKQAQAKWENVQELISWMGNLQKNNDDDEGLDPIVSQLTLMSILENNEDKKEADSVQLMTLHAAKGLEFANVYLVGFEEDTLPHHRCQDDEGIQEERRLAYVGITRAKKQLTISYAKTRQKYGDAIQCEVSRFLQEIPEELLKGAEHLKPLSKEEKKTQGNNAIADLKAMLKQP